MKKALVTGGAGFIGTNLIQRLILEGYQVFSLDNYSTGKIENEVPRANYINDDIKTNDRRIQVVTARPERILSAESTPTGGGCPDGPSKQAVGLKLVKMLAKSCQKFINFQIFVQISKDFVDF